DRVDEGVVQGGLRVGAGVGQDGDTVVEVGGLQGGGEDDSAGGDAGQDQVVDVLGGQDLLEIVAGEGADAGLVDDDLALGGGDVGVDGGTGVVGREEVGRKGAEGLVAGVGVRVAAAQLKRYVDDRDARRAGRVEGVHGSGQVILGHPGEVV